MKKMSMTGMMMMMYMCMRMCMCCDAQKSDVLSKE